MPYTTIDNPELYFKTKLYAGNGSSNAVTGVGFQPDMNWCKLRTTAYNHVLVDSIRGVTKVLRPNLQNGEDTYTNAITSFDSDGFTLGADTNGEHNRNGDNIVSWNWKAGGSASSNSNGSITSSVSASTDAGFSIVSWTGNGSNGATIGHGLGATPAIIITKRRDDTGDWLVGGSAVDTVRGGANSLLLLNTDAAMDSNSEVYQTFSSTTFQVGVNAYTNTNNATMISYCFAEKKGYSKFGSYIGNGNADGVFCFTAMKPSFVMIKGTTTTEHWLMYDNKRKVFNSNDEVIYANLSNAEDTNTGLQIDFLSNGFKLRGASANLNNSGQTFIFMAFAENPFVTSTGVPATAR